LWEPDIPGFATVQFRECGVGTDGSGPRRQWQYFEGYSPANDLVFQLAPPSSGKRSNEASKLSTEAVICKSLWWSDLKPILSPTLRYVTTAGGVGDHGADVFLSEGRKVGENMLDGVPLSEACKNSADGDASSFEYGLTAGDRRVAGYVALVVQVLARRLRSLESGDRSRPCSSVRRPRR